MKNKYGYEVIKRKKLLEILKNLLYNIYRK